jgi:hypothetical protein
MKRRLRCVKSIILFAILAGLYPHLYAAPRGQLAISRSEYLDRARAIWTAQMIGLMTGLLFEHKPASVLSDTPLVQPRGFAPVDLTTYRKQPVIVRLYDFILVPNLQAGNSYWRHIEVQ